MTAALPPGDLAVDRQLTEISESFRFLLDLTPVNTRSARARFLSDGADEPGFEYRPLEDDPTVIAAELDKVDVESVSDPTVAHLVRAKRRELDLQVEMLAARGTTEFPALSIELYGAVTPALLASAEDLLGRLDATPDDASADGASCLDAAAFARLAEAELDHYRALEPDLSAHVEIRDDVSGVLVADGNLLVAANAQVSPGRAAVLLQHEIGTHVLTFVNGSRQPLRLLAAGLAGYEETQEGLALVAEHLSGGLTSRRLRQLAARVVAVHGMAEGLSFRDVHDDLLARGFSPGGAFTIAMRVFRSGGLTKDLVYLRGLVELVSHVRDAADLDVLWLGKMSLSDAPLVAELWARGALHDPTLLPRYLDEPATAARLDALVAARSALELVEA